MAEYEALVIGLVSALRMGVQKLRVQGDSKLIIQQVNGEFSLKEGALASYRTAVQKLMKLFSSIQFEHVPRSHNKHADALATLASRAEIKDDVAEIRVIRKTLRATTTDLIPDHALSEEDWRTSIVENLTQPSSWTDTRQLEDFTLIEGQLYYRGSGGILAPAISEEEGKVELERIHESTCADNDISLYRRIQRQGYFWPSMAKDAARVQRNCPKCQESVDISEALFIQEAGDWRQPYLDYLQHRFSLLIALVLPKFGKGPQNSLSRKGNYLGKDLVEHLSDV